MPRKKKTQPADPPDALDEAAAPKPKRKRQSRYAPKPILAPICPYCGIDSVLDDGTMVYGHTNFGNVWICRNHPGCSARVGCHRGGTGTRPLGTMANEVTRKARTRAHAAFDPLWKRKVEKHGVEKYRARGAGYRWLAEQMGIEFEACHISQFDYDQCMLVIKICTPPYGRKTPVEPSPESEPTTSEEGTEEHGRDHPADQHAA